MPLREYQASNGQPGCPVCRKGFERLEAAGQAACTRCPQCGTDVKRVLSAPRVGASLSGQDDRAREAGFHKLRRLGKGEYEKEY